MRLHPFLKVVCGTGVVVAAQKENLANAGIECRRQGGGADLFPKLQGAGTEGRNP